MDIQNIDVKLDSRIVTGLVQFGDDRPGVFIRGDNAVWMGAALEVLGGKVHELLGAKSQPELLMARQLEGTIMGLAYLLKACTINLGPPDG
jgi:hypothetical protein